jgi:WD40-like Beta Propeller Repeat
MVTTGSGSRRASVRASTLLIAPSAWPVAIRRPSELSARWGRSGSPAPAVNGRPSRRSPARSHMRTVPSAPTCKASCRPGLPPSTTPRSTAVRSRRSMDGGSISPPRAGGFGGIDIWVAERPNRHAQWGTPVILGAQINTEHNEFCPSPGHDGRFMFVSNRPGGCGGGDIYVTRFRPRRGWQSPRKLGCTINSAAEEAGRVRISRALYFSSTRAGSSDIYAGPAFGPWIGPPTAVSGLNTPFEDARPYIRPDGLEIVFDSTRPGGLGGFDIWSARRPRRDAPWSEPMNLLAAVNSDAARSARHCPAISRRCTSAPPAARHKTCSPAPAPADQPPLRAAGAPTGRRPDARRPSPVRRNGRVGPP